MRKLRNSVANERGVAPKPAAKKAGQPWGKGLLGTTPRYDYEVRDEKDYFKDVPQPRVPKEMVRSSDFLVV